MKIRISKKEELANSSFKLPKSMKNNLDKIAKKENTTVSKLVRSFLDYSMQSYKEGAVLKVGDEDFMKSFRACLKIEDKVIASGMIGNIKKIEGDYIKLEINEGLEIEMHLDAVTDILSPIQGRSFPTMLKD